MPTICVINITLINCMFYTFICCKPTMPYMKKYTHFF